MRYLAMVACVTASPALADYARMEAQGSVEEAFARLQSAVEEAGATIFATVDHGAGASEAGMDLGASKLLIFGNPQLGTPVMQADMMAGLALPMKMLVYADGDRTYVAYEEVEDMFQRLDVGEDLEVLGKMEGALEKFAGAAAGG